VCVDAVIMVLSARHLAVIAFLASTAEQAIISLVIPYCQHRFKFSPTTVAYMAAVMGGSTVFTQLGLFQVLVRRIGPQYLLVVRLQPCVAVSARGCAF